MAGGESMWKLMGGLLALPVLLAVSYTHLTLPTNSLV